jgi:hypothetical protein
MQPTSTVTTAAPVLHPFVASSIDPTKVSATITGLGGTLAGLVMIFVTLYHFPLSLGQYNAFVQEMAVGGSAIATSISTIYMLFGLFRKGIAIVFAKKTVSVQTTTVTTLVPNVQTTPEGSASV